MNIAIVKFNGFLLALIEQQNEYTGKYYTKMRQVSENNTIRLGDDEIDVSEYIRNGKVVAINGE